MILQKQAQAARAMRFPFSIPLRYRRGDVPDWHECRTVNISRTGILFHTDQAMSINSIMEILVQFPSDVTLSCSGSVVRADDSTCAVRIHNCRMISKAAGH